jgi:ferritin-like protein
MKNYLLQFFKFAHLPKGPMQETSERFAELATTLDEVLPKNPEATAAFRKLLEAKDCAVRSLIFEEPQ